MTTNNLLTSQNQWTMLSSAVIAVISHDCYSEEMINVDIEVRRLALIHDSSFKTTLDQS